MRQPHRLLIALLLLPALLQLGLINPSLQPAAVYDRWESVARYRIAEVDGEARTARLVLDGAVKGDPPATVVLSAPDAALAEIWFTLIDEGAPVVACLGKRDRGTLTDDVLFYAGEGRWQAAEMAGGRGTWTWTADLGDAYFGCFNGHPDRLHELMRDIAADRDYFPPKPCAAFRDELVVGTLPGPAAGVALRDLDGDGHLDVWACSPAGGRLFLQTAPLAFSDATEAAGLAGVAARCVSAADVDGDGRQDLLLDGTLWHCDRPGHWTRTALLPEPSAQVRACAFADLDADGRPDAVVAAGAGLRVHLHAGGVAPWRDATAAAGLDGIADDGRSALGDWNGDGRPDLFVTAGGGRVLVQGDDGRFAPAGRPLELDFAMVDGSALTGGACFAPLWTPGGAELLVATENLVHLFGARDRAPALLNPYGNEITEGTPGMWAALAEDLNADGTVDAYVLSCAGQPNLLLTNRGYGSFMADHKYRADILRGDGHGRGSAGAAAGDVDGDGAVDLCLTGADGRIVLLVNDALRERGTIERPTRDERRRAALGLLSVVPAGRGADGADVQVLDASGTVIARRTSAAAAVTGSCAPLGASLALPAGDHRVRVRFSDGAVAEAAVAIRPRESVRLAIAHP